MEIFGKLFGIFHHQFRKCPLLSWTFRRVIAHYLPQPRWTPPCTNPDAVNGAEEQFGRRYATAVVIALATPPGNSRRRPFEVRSPSATTLVPSTGQDFGKAATLQCSEIAPGSSTSYDTNVGVGGSRSSLQQERFS